MNCGFLINLHGKFGNKENMENLFKQAYKNKTVLVTGHTGFKGSWLCIWLTKLGANVIGYSLEIPTNPNHFELLDIQMESIVGDIRDFDKLEKTISQYQPDIIFHLAAQPIVAKSYKDPIYTYTTNVMGTLNLFESSKKNRVPVIVNITTDKVYENFENTVAFKETDSLGGYDPYSASKACSEIVTSSYRDSFFNVNKYKKDHITLLASCRSGNVIGGGDWAEQRIMTDIIHSIMSKKILEIRSPNSIRPWQHVLEPLSGYLVLGQKLLDEKKEFATSWNFSSKEIQNVTVQEVVNLTKNYWNDFEYIFKEEEERFHESKILKLNCEKASKLLQWQTVWDIDTTVFRTILWYKSFYEKNRITTLDDIDSYVNDAVRKGLEWTKK